MLVINKKYKPIIPNKPFKEKETDFNSSIMPTIQGEGIKELIQKVKDMKVKELNKKRNMNSNSKISFN
jgi:hypothetical protein